MQWNITEQLKGINYWHMHQRRLIIQTLLGTKERKHNNGQKKVLISSWDITLEIQKPRFEALEYNQLVKLQTLGCFTFIIYKREG